MVRSCRNSSLKAFFYPFRLVMAVLPQEDIQFGQTAGGLLAFEWDHGFVCSLAALLDPSQHACVDLWVLVGWCDIMHAAVGGGFSLAAACVHRGQIDCQIKEGTLNKNSYVFRHFISIFIYIFAVKIFFLTIGTPWKHKWFMVKLQKKKVFRQLQKSYHNNQKGCSTQDTQIHSCWRNPPSLQASHRTPVPLGSWLLFC